MSFLKHPDMSAKPKLPFILWFRKRRELWLPSTSLWSQDLEPAQNLYHMFDHNLCKLCSERSPVTQPKQPRGAERWQEGGFPSKAGYGHKTAVTTCRKHWDPSIAMQKQTSWSLWSHSSATDFFRTQRKAELLRNPTSRCSPSSRAVSAGHTWIQQMREDRATSLPLGGYLRSFCLVWRQVQLVPWLKYVFEQETYR